MSHKNLNHFQILVRKFISRLIPIAKYRRKIRKKWLRRENPIPSSPSLHDLEEVIFFHKSNFHLGEEKVLGESITVIIPVYNGLHHLEKLFQSLFPHTTEGVKFIIIDDCSPNSKVFPFLQEQAKKWPQVILIRNEKNLGFVKSVNKGVSLSDTDFVVLLNTDVIVPDQWLKYLISPFFQNPKVASITPFTNSACYFSFPQFGDNELPRGFSMEEINAAFSRIGNNINEYSDINSNVGFCMAIKKQCWDAIGPLDEETFGKGYGEETDWCMRAVSKGWKNVLAPNLFVYHNHGGSFPSNEKKRLCDEHLKIIQKRWPTEIRGINNFAQNDPWMPLRFLAGLYMAELRKSKSILFIDLDYKAGGAYAYRQKWMSRQKDKGYLPFVLEYQKGDESNWKLVAAYLTESLHVSVKEIDTLECLFRDFGIKNIFINNFSYCSNTENFINKLISWKQKYNLHIHYVFHDFYSLCPSFFLLDANTHFCDIGKKATESCDSCLRHNPNCTIPRDNIQEWRKVWGRFFEECDQFTCFSESTLNLISRVYNLKGKASITEHEFLAPFSTKYTAPDQKAPLTLGFVGPFSPSKGSDIILKIADLLKKDYPKSQIIIIGENHQEKSCPPNIIFHGKYNRNDLPELLTQYGIKVVLFCSPWPETFSYVCQECMEIQIPLVCFDFGAPAERIKKYHYSYGRTSDMTPEAMYQTACDLLRFLGRQ